MKFSHNALLFMHFAGDKVADFVRKSARYFDDYVSEVLRESPENYELHDFENLYENHTLVIRHKDGTIRLSNEKALILGMQAARKRLTRDQASDEDKRFLLTNDLGL
nr:hypothetical protein [Pseudomonas sp. s4]